MTAKTEYGELLGGLQAPHVTRWGHSSNPTYVKFYGSWDAICMATSADGKKFHRVLDKNGNSPIFREGYGNGSHWANTRDPMLFPVQTQPHAMAMHLIYSAFPCMPTANGSSVDCDGGEREDGVWARTISAPGNATSSSVA